MANPLTEERLNHLKDQAAELLKSFSILYLKNVGATLFEKIKKGLEAEEKLEWKLLQREFDSVPRSNLGFGHCFMKKGAGPGAFDKWKPQFIVENQDYNIDVFGNEKEFLNDKKPSHTIKTAGYRVVKQDVDAHFRTELESLASGLGISDTEVDAMTGFFPCTWALCHPQRTNYIFQIPEIKDSACGFLSFICGGSKNAVAPADSEENDQERRRLIDIMQRCVVKNKPRDVESVHGAAFDKTCKDIPSSIPSLSNWKDHGSEGEMLVDMLMLACMSDLRDGILSDLQGPTSIRLAVWFKTSGIIQTILTKLADAAMTQIQSAGKAIEEKVTPVIKPGLEKILKIKGKIEEQIKNRVLDRIGEMVGKFVTPFIKPLLQVFEKPLQAGFLNGKSTFSTQVAIENLPNDANQRNAMLDGIPRNFEFVNQVQTTTQDLVSPLNSLKELSKDVFEDMDVEEIRINTQDLLLKTLDAAVFTVEDRLDKGAPAQNSLKEEILAGYDHDAQIARSMFVQDTVRGVLICAFKKLISPVTDPLIDEFNSAIPDEMKDFLNIQQILDNLIDSIVGNPINKMVEGSYPYPKP